MAEYFPPSYQTLLNRNMKKLTYPLLVILSLLALSTAAHAATEGTDNASATAYNSGWTDGTDGSITGPGAYGQWFLNADTADIIHEIASVSSLSANPPSLDTSGESFRMVGQNGQEATAFRFIDPAGLDIGQTFSIELAVNFRNGFKGIDLRGTADETIFNFNIGGDDYVVNNATTGNGSIGDTYSDNTLFTLGFEQTSALGGNWTIARSGGVSDFDSGTYTGLARSIKLYVGSTDGTNADAFFANSLSTVPEPSSVAVGFAVLGLAATAYTRRKKK